MASLPVLFGGLVAGAIALEYGWKTVKAEWQSSSSASSGSTPQATAGAYQNPVPQATRWGRTDQGVDVDASPGSPVVSIGDAKVIGIIPGWYDGQPYVWTQLLSGPEAGKYVYYAEQLIPSVQAGDTVSAGQQIGTVAQTGTGLEIGYALSSGETLARSLGDYTEGIATSAGAAFRKLLADSGVPVGTGAGQSSGTTIGPSDYPS